MDEPLAEGGPIQDLGSLEKPVFFEKTGFRTVTIGQALIAGLAVLVTAGALALGLLAGRLLPLPPQPLARTTGEGQGVGGQAPTLAQPQVQFVVPSSQLSRSSPASSAGISVDVDVGDSPSAGKSAPDFTLEDLQGQAISLSDLKGQPVLINFWATWCPPCRFEMPAIEAAYQKYKDQGFVVLAVDVQEPRGLVQAYVKKLDLTFPVVLDLDGQVATQYRIRAYPTSYFVNRAGEITQVHRGMMTGQMIERYLADILPGGS